MGRRIKITLLAQAEGPRGDANHTRNATGFEETDENNASRRSTGAKHSMSPGAIEWKKSVKSTEKKARSNRARLGSKFMLMELNQRRQMIKFVWGIMAFAIRMSLYV